jgi:hypothetical protein
MSKSHKPNADEAATTQGEGQAVTDATDTQAPAVDVAALEARVKAAEEATLAAQLDAEEAYKKLAEAESRLEIADVALKEHGTAVANLFSDNEKLTARVAELEAAQSQPSASEAAAPPEPGEPAVYQVEIPNCLVGRQFVLATCDHEALDKYKAACGITAHSQPAKVSSTPLDPNNLPEGVKLFGETQ